MTALLALSVFALLAAAVVFMWRTLFSAGRRMEMFGKLSLCLFGMIAATIALGVSVEGEFNDASQKAVADASMAPSVQTATPSTQGSSCEEDHTACESEWEFKRESHLFYKGREECKSAAAQEAREHAADGYRGMTGIISFGPEPFEQFAYINWHEMLAEDAMVMKDEEMKLQVYASAWAEGRSVCLFDFNTETVKRISVWFD